MAIQIKEYVGFFDDKKKPESKKKEAAASKVKPAKTTKKTSN